MTKEKEKTIFKTKNFYLACYLMLKKDFTFEGSEGDGIRKDFLFSGDSEKIEKDTDDWQQPEAITTKLLSNFTEPNDLILDPMMGTGTSGVSAIANGRRFIGYELDQARFDIAKGRLANGFS